MQLYYIFKHLVNVALTLMFVYFWIGGIIIAEGWLKLIAIFFFPYSWYLFIAKYLMP